MIVMVTVAVTVKNFKLDLVWVKVMPGDFCEFTVNIGLGNFLAGGTLFLNSYDTLSYDKREKKGMIISVAWRIHTGQTIYLIYRSIAFQKVGDLLKGDFNFQIYRTSF